MLIKITLTLVVVTIALSIIGALYISSLDNVEYLRFDDKKYTKRERNFFQILSVISMTAFVMVFVTIISLIFKYL
nr:MAG TPA: hypothetical protein [Caudoviricetes sp.]